jgi:monovalent cation/proton antiporter MnhG/PhaG subunit
VRHLVGLVLVAAGCAVTVLAALGAARMPRDVFARLHFVTPITSVGIPLVAVGLSVESGQLFTVAELLFIAVLAFVAGPILESESGRVAAQNRGLISQGQPE